MPELKRPAPTDSTALMLSKRSRNELMPSQTQNGAVVQSGPARTSNMEAPIMLLTGHGGEIYSAKLKMKTFYYVIENRPTVANLYLLKEFAQLN